MAETLFEPDIPCCRCSYFKEIWDEYAGQMNECTLSRPPQTYHRSLGRYIQPYGNPVGKVRGTSDCRPNLSWWRLW